MKQKGMRLVLLLLLAGCLCGEVSAQRNRLNRVRGTRILNDSIALNATEVTMLDWMFFIVNNNYRADLFPDTNAIPYCARLIYADLRRKEDAQYLDIVDNSISERAWCGNK